MTEPNPTEISLKRTPLYDLHLELGARLVPFAGYEMPVQYPSGIIAEHVHTRAQAGLFDVSHMGQIRLSGRAGRSPAAALERLVCGDLQALAVSRMRYTLFTNEAGGILDDLMVANIGDHLMLVVNAGRKLDDGAHLRAALSEECTIEELPKRALLALQGPAAAGVLARFVPDVARMPFMSAAFWTIDGANCLVTRSGYTGEDGFEISVANGAAEGLARRLLAEPEVRPVGLGTRDSLRLEAGLCLYGHDIDVTTSPIEAGLAWAIGKRRRSEGGFPGYGRIRRELDEGPPQKRVGLLPEGRAPMREETRLLAGGRPIGKITSGGFGPSVGHPIAMGYVASAAAQIGALVEGEVRGSARPARIVALPFVPTRFYRGA